ncbi:MAG: CDP-diacylglycerol--glycerol-3-phosphate 3-phosphatidyltransferase [Elusimicrobiota bacterium]
MNLNLQKNLANKLTLLRIAFVIPFSILLTSEKKSLLFFALIIFLFAGVTDFFDGYIARKRDEVTNAGKFFDPLADKLFICSALIVFMGKDSFYLPAWPVILIICREFIINAFRSFASSCGRVIPASAVGKIKTVIQMLAVGIIILFLIIQSHLALVYPFMAFVSLFTAVSGVVYIKKNIDIIT